MLSFEVETIKTSLNVRSIKKIKKLNFTSILKIDQGWARCCASVIAVTRKLRQENHKKISKKKKKPQKTQQQYFY
jgi:hypothetical protein